MLEGVADVQGDKIRNVRTVAVSHGTRCKRPVEPLFPIGSSFSRFPCSWALFERKLCLSLLGLTDSDAPFIFLASESLLNDKDSLRLKSTAFGGHDARSNCLSCFGLACLVLQIRSYSSLSIPLITFAN